MVVAEVVAVSPQAPRAAAVVVVAQPATVVPLALPGEPLVVDPSASTPTRPQSTYLLQLSPLLRVAAAVPAQPVAVAVTAETVTTAATGSAAQPAVVAAAVVAAQVVVVAAQVAAQAVPRLPYTTTALARSLSP